METMYPGKVNSPQTELASAIDDEQTTIPLLDASKLPPAPNLATIGTGEDAETILYTGVSGNNLTGVTRGFQGVAKAWAQGTKVARLFTEYDYDALRQNILFHASRHAAGGPDEITPEMIGAASQADFAAHEADTTAHGIGDKSILLTTNKNTIVEAINELFTFANDGKNSIAAVIGSPATNGDTFATLANHITNHKTSLANSLGSGSGSDSLQTLVNTRLQGLKNTLATNLTNKGQSSSGTETLLNLINKVANINTGKRWASGTATSSSGMVSFEHPNGTTRNMYYVTVTGLPFNPSTVILYHSSSHPGFSILFPASLNTLDNSGRIITSWYDDLSFHATNIYTFKLSGSAHNNSGFLLPIGDTANVSSKSTNWLAIE